MLREGIFYPSTTHKLTTGCGPLFLTIVYDEKKTRPIHILSSMGKAGGCATAHLSSLSHEMSHILETEKFSDRVKAYSELTGFNCHESPCCIEQFVRTIMAVELSMNEERQHE